MLKQGAARTEELVSRIRGLDSGKRRQLFTRLQQMGIEVARLPIVPAIDGSDTPLSYAQQRQWFLWQLEPHGCAYNIPAALRLRGALDVAALAESVAWLGRQQASLRTRLEEVEGEVRQRFDQDGIALLQVEDCPLPSAERERKVQASVATELCTPFNLTAGPLWRVRLLRMADDDHLLLLSLHHLISDGWSMGVLVEQLLGGYASFAMGTEPVLPAPAIQYGDYAHWQREWMESGERERQLGWWMQALGRERPVLELPTDHARPPRQSYRGARLEVALPSTLGYALRELAQAHEATPFMLLLASFQALLHRYSGQVDIRVGVPNANRNRLETEGLIGLFVNTQVMRAEISQGLRFDQLLEQVRLMALGAQAHQDLPFEQLVEALQPERSLSINPLFQVMYNHQHVGTGRIAQQLPGLQVEALNLDNQTAQLDLALETYDHGDAFSAVLIYATDLFEAASVERLAKHWLHLLHSIIADPQGRIDQLPMLDAEERELALRGWNATATEYPLDTPVQRLIEAQVARTPDAEALVFGDVRLSYAALDARANQLANRLIAAGVGPDVLVGIAVERSVEMVVGLLAILKAGGAYVPMDPELPSERLAYLFEDSGIALLLTQSHLSLPMPEGLTVLALDALDLSAYSSDNPNITVAPENLAYVIYTSGSTGKPKGAGNRHSALTNRLCWMQQAYQLDASDTVLQKTPFSFDVSVWEFFWPLMTGARLAVAGPGDHRDPSKLVELIHAHDVTTLHFVPSMLQAFLTDAQVSSCTGLKRIVCSGEALPVDAQQQVFTKLPQAGLYNLYGPTEAAIDVTHWTCREEGADTVPIGQPIANLSTYVLDAELNPVPVGVIGELYLGGEGLARGYHRRPALTAERFATSPFGNGERLYRTGDLARQRADGVIEYAGRIDYQVKIRGLRIELGEIEARLMEQPEVREAVVLAVELAGSQQLVGYVVASDGSSDEGSLRDTLKRRLQVNLPEYMIPVQWMFLDALPLSPNGKLERRALPRPEVGQQAEYVAPRSELEARIAGIWQEVLKVERVGMQDNFFELGGHSLLATQVISRIRQTVGLDAALKQLFEHARLDDFVRSLKPAQGAQRPALVPVKREGGVPLSYAQERQWFLWQMEPGSDAYHIPLALRLNGELRQDVLENCLQTLVQRHETLRTCFAVQGEQVMQVIAAQAHVPLTCVEVANQNELAIALQEAVQQPFDLMAGPLLRAWLVSVRGQEQVLLLNLHHIVTDAWSMRVLASELLELYAAACEGRAARLAVLPVQYADYAQWQRQWLEGGERARQLAYWTERMAGGSTVLQLPTDRARPAVQSHRGARHMFEIPQPLASQLFKLAHAARATPFMLLLASFQVLLHRYSGQTQIRVGVPIANRNVLETEGLIGFFVNTQVHQAECAAHLSFRELLSQVRMHALQGQDYQDLPFEQLVDALQPERSLSHTPLFQVMYNHRERGARELAGQPLAGLHIEELSWDTGTAQFDLTLDTYESQDGLRAALTYATDLFDAQTITRMAGHWLNLLQALSSDMDQALGDLVMLEVTEQQALLPDWQQQADTWQGELAVHQRIAQWARQTPDAPAVQCAGRQLSYAQLDAQANALATVLIERGVRPETLVGIALARSLELIVGLLAIHKAGAAYVPLDPQYPAERLAYLIEDSGMALLLTTEALEPQLPLPAQLPVLLLEACDLQRVAADPGVAVAPGNLAYVIYTSGSTGQPKGVCVEHGPLAMHCRAIGERYEMSTADCELHFMSFAFDGAHERWLTSLTHGARLLLRDEQLWSPEQTYQQMHVAGVSVAAFPPAYLQQLAEHAERDGNPPPVRVYCFGGDAVPQASYALARRALRPTWIINGYGPTETVVTPLIWKAGVEDHCQAAYAPIGSRIGERSTLVLDAGLALLPSRLPGELYLGGSGVARGYLRRPALTAERFVPDPYGPPGARLYRTGDLVSRREEGVFDYLGRVDNQVKVRGFRIELGEIEAILQRQAQVREAVVVARDLGQGAQLVAYLLADASSRDSAWQAEARLTIRAALKQTLPGYMVPSFLLFVEQWPLTPNGKLDRKALPNPDLDGLQQAYRAPQSALEQQVAQAWQQVLGVARIGLDDNFFELGGHSLLATQVTSQLQQQLSANLALDLLFKAETLADYSQAVAACVNGKLDEDMSDMHAFLAELEAN